MILCSQELSYVAGSQMLDIYWGSGKKIIEKDAILNLYRYKTGRYTFALPLQLGALVTGKSKKILVKLEKLGELLGIIFQIKDDDIGIFGAEPITGKPVGSDLKEGKKTLFLTLLYEKADRHIRDKLDSMVGVPDINEKDIKFIRDKIISLGVREQILNMIKKQSEQVKSLIDSLPSINNRAKNILYDLVEYNLKRNK